MSVKDAINAVSIVEGTKPSLKGAGKRCLLLSAYLILFNLGLLLFPESTAAFSPGFFFLGIAYV